MFASQLWGAREQRKKDIEGTRVVWTYPVKLYSGATKMPRVPCEAFEVKKPQEMKLEELQDIWECWRKWTEHKGRGSSCLNHGRGSWGKQWGCNTLKPFEAHLYVVPLEILSSAESSGALQWLFALPQLDSTWPNTSRSISIAWLVLYPSEVSSAVFHMAVVSDSQLGMLLTTKKKHCLKKREKSLGEFSRLRNIWGDINRLKLSSHLLLFSNSPTDHRL